MKRTDPSKVEKLLFQLTIFLIPSNLAYHFITKSSYINGILVDYLIPKLYLSDIPILILLFLWLLKSWKKWSKRKKIIDYKKLSIHPTILSTLYTLLLMRGLFSVNPLASTWFWVKILEFSLFFLWIKTHLIKGKSLSRFYKLIRTPLVISLLLQSLVGLYQVIFQKSLADYWFFGETALKISSQIDKIHLRNYFPGLGTNLLIPAYGTTPHNNVLAGFLSVGIIMLFLSTRDIGKNILYQKVILYITYALSLITLLLTFSGSAWLSLLIAISIIGLSNTSSKHPTKLTSNIIVSLVTIIIISITIIPLNISNSSIVRRQQLNQISLKIFIDNPLMGVGLNNFTSHMQKYGSISSHTQFIQPSHNIFLLWLAETGLIGLLMLVLVIRKIRPPDTYYMLRTTPIIMLMIIGFLDHYPITLQTGQIFTLLSLSLCSKQIKPSFI